MRAQPPGDFGKSRAAPPSPPEERTRVYRGAAENSRLPIAITAGASHVVQYTNAAFQQLLQLEAQALTGRRICELFMPETDRLKAFIDQVYQTGTFDCLSDLRYADFEGALRHATFLASPTLDARAREGQLVVQVMDTTENVRARLHELRVAAEIREANQSLVLAGLREQALADEAVQRTEELDQLVSRLRKLVAVVETSSDLIAIATPEGELAYINEAGRKLVGLPVGELTGRGSVPARKLFFPEDLPAVDKLVCPSAQESRWEGEFRLRHQTTGAAIPVIANFFSIRDRESGRTLGMAGVVRDITVQKEWEAASQERDAFEKQLLGIVGHDLGTPLSAIQMSASLMLRRPGLDERQAVALTRIVEASERAGRMTRDLLDFTKARLGGGIAVRLRPLHLEDMVRRVIDELRVQYPTRGIRLELGGTGESLGDWDRIAQVLQNLVNNAIHYGTPDSELSVRTGGDDASVWFEVHNEGDPIPELALPRLFEPMTQGTPHERKPSSSIGLGLFIVKSIVGGHGGKITVRTDAGKGTTFRVELPRRPL